ncbi:MAG TPA: M56 family metallopeptidase, partial [Steroidobacteraceae bacterium]
MQATLAASTAIVLVGLVRKPLRRAVGARAAYWLWLLVPSSVLAVVLPAPSQPVAMVIAAVPHSLNGAVGNAMLGLSAAPTSFNYLIAGLVAWLAGVGAMSAVAVRRQRNFIRSLGRVSSRADGTYRSESGLEPMLVGLCRPRIVLPADFEARYTPEEAAWVLAHERAHLQRGDAVVNAIATGALCVFWFNPLTYLAVGWLRFDQDLAADALVLAAAGTSRRGYATALLKAQILCDSPWRLPVGCQWQSSHPLTERIATLGRPLPGLYRRCLGVSIALALVVCSVCAVWATQPAPQPRESASAIAAALKAHPP